jgi:chromosome segregation ATPase
MMDQVELLEQHVEALLRLLESAKIKVAELEGANSELQGKVNHLEEVELELTTQNEQLQNQVHQLEGEVEEMAGKESQIRDRLRTILGKIDTIENELTMAGGAQ